MEEIIADWMARCGLGEDVYSTGVSSRRRRRRRIKEEDEEERRKRGGEAEEYL